MFVRKLVLAGVMTVMAGNFRHGLWHHRSRVRRG